MGSLNGKPLSQAGENSGLRLRTCRGSLLVFFDDQVDQAVAAMDVFFREHEGTTAQTAKWQTQFSIPVFHTYLAKDLFVCIFDIRGIQAWRAGACQPD